MKLDRASSGISEKMRNLLHGILKEKNLLSFIKRIESEIVQEKAPPETLEKLVYLILVYIYYKNNIHFKFQESHRWEINYEEVAR